MVDDVVGGQPSARARDDVRLDCLSGVRVRHADHRGLGHGRVFGDHVLDLARVDVEAADQHQLPAAVDQEQVAVVVGVGDVAGGQPAIAVRAARGRRASSPRTGSSPRTSISPVSPSSTGWPGSSTQPQLDPRDGPADGVGLAPRASRLVSTGAVSVRP